MIYDSHGTKSLMSIMQNHHWQTARMKAMHKEIQEYNITKISLEFNIEWGLYFHFTVELMNSTC